MPIDAINFGTESATGSSSPSMIIEQFRQNFDFLVSGQLQRNFLALKIIFISLSALFLIFILLILKKDEYDYFDTVFGNEIRARRSYKTAGLKQAQKYWQKIKSRFNKQGEAHYKLALIEAEDFLDDVLVRLGLGGNNLDERLSRLSSQDVPVLNELQGAHFLCQNIIRDPDYKIEKERAFENFLVFEKALWSLDAL